MIAAVVVVVLLAVLVTAVPTVRRRASEHRRRADVDDALADVADLLILVLGAGVSVHDAVQWLADRGPAATHGAFVDVQNRVAIGQSLTQALRPIADDLGPSYQPLVAALTSAVRDGAPTSTLLLRLGDEARTARRRQHDRTARALPVRLLFPLVMCSLPAVVLGAVLPLVLVAFGRL